MTIKGSFTSLQGSIAIVKAFLTLNFRCPVKKAKNCVFFGGGREMVSKCVISFSGPQNFNGLCETTSFDV